MADFINAFEQGVEAAKRASIAKSEMDDVFADLNEQLNKASSGKLHLFLGQSALNKILSSFKMISSQPEDEDKPVFMNIYATNPNVSNSSKVLAKWKSDPAGYPCTISWRDNEICCLDRESLEIAISKLLSDPVVGGVLYALVQLEPKKEEQGTDK